MTLPPLSALGPELTADQLIRYRRNIDVVGLGEDGQRRLLNARVLVIGAGGLGSVVLPYLAAAGVGVIGVADGDVVEVANLQRQVLHDTPGVGTNKAESAADRLTALNPGVRVRTFPRMMTGAALSDLAPEFDLVMDCCDTFAAKLMLADACARARVPLVWGAAVGMQGQVSVFGLPGPDGRVLSLRDLFPDEPSPGSYPLATEIGVLGAMVGQVGSLMATEALKLLAGFGEPLVGRVWVLDAARGRWDVLAIGGIR